MSHRNLMLILAFLIIYVETFNIEADYTDFVSGPSNYRLKGKSEYPHLKILLNKPYDNSLKFVHYHFKAKEKAISEPTINLGFAVDRTKGLTYSLLKEGNITENKLILSFREDHSYYTLMEMAHGDFSKAGNPNVAVIYFGGVNENKKDFLYNTYIDRENEIKLYINQNEKNPIWQFMLNSIILPNNKIIDLNLNAILEPEECGIIFPKKVVEEIYKTYFNKKCDLMKLSDGLNIRCSEHFIIPDFEITFVLNGKKIAMNCPFYTHPITHSKTFYLLGRDVNNIVLGIKFLEKYKTVFDYDKGSITFYYYKND